ncbi:MAG: thioredoxin family protein [Planctomycetes bacterium]|nr:thioredoxin family protein [Planctomycetota bacterium]
MNFTLQIGDKAPFFNLCGTDGLSHNLKDFSESDVLVLIFTCNHCPYVKNSIQNTLETFEKFNPRGVDFVAINSNSPNTYEEDSFENMVALMEENMYPWMYLSDQTQDTAKAYGALKTPHFFVFDKQRKLIYTGRALDNPREPEKATVNDLENALTDHLAGKKIKTPLTNPIGCNVKWEGKDAHWMPPEACDLV